MENHQGKATQNERGRLSIPQVYVQLQFGVSWTPRHTPQSHTMTYISKSLRQSSEFPRQGGQPVTKPVAKQTSGQSRTRELNAAHQKKAASRPHNGHATRRADDRRPDRSADATRQHTKKSNPQRQHRSETRGAANDRGSSAPPPLSHNNPWVANADYMTPAMPQATRSSRQSAVPQVWKNLPAPPSQFRLGADGLPWSSWAYPEGYPDPEEGQEMEEEVAIFANKPTTVNLSPESRLERRHTDDPARVQELEKLSLAMVTVDNGFENQWWYQGQRETTDWLTQGVDDTEVLHSPQSDPGDNRLVSAIEQTPITGPNWSATYDKNASMRMIVSPVSENSMSPAESFRPIQRSLTTRSDELFIGM
ncbi:hypothetical protein Micbo1qcDRAFT_164818 [Microdochium bolleyi]|uniref:Uncharacterized protein n=1 Tax=Microdochium bolleyi TaxID=196109 RepID=A0A136IZA5_9PEZI|nr:hypothetical protein Micbo1qcDRAFT_164818 [Microdochium bolleyi]